MSAQDRSVLDRLPRSLSILPDEIRILDQVLGDEIAKLFIEE
ncbi:hypothetical protein [Sphingomonas sp.]|nr:hypothetical protein [Sphingomonas sp.]